MSMGTRLVDWDELYPFFFFSKNGSEGEFTDDELVRIEAANAEFLACQDIMKDRIKGA
jgi:hypothetical protein